MINHKVELDLRCARHCIIYKILRVAVVTDNADANMLVPAMAATATTNARFQISKLYVPVVTFSINDNIQFLEHLNQAFRETIAWNKYRSKIRAEPKNNNLECIIFPTFRNINRLLVFSFKNGDDYPTRNSFDKCYMSL